MLWYGMVWLVCLLSSIFECSVECCGMVWRDLVWYGMVWLVCLLSSIFECSVECCGMVWYGMVSMFIE